MTKKQIEAALERGEYTIACALEAIFTANANNPVTISKDVIVNMSKHSNYIYFKTEDILRLLSYISVKETEICGYMDNLYSFWSRYK